jgi:hypothetical protein
MNGRDVLSNCVCQVATHGTSRPNSVNIYILTQHAKSPLPASTLNSIGAKKFRPLQICDYLAFFLYLRMYWAEFRGDGQVTIVTQRETRPFLVK